jgi:hypothetical protein
MSIKEIVLMYLGAAVLLVCLWFVIAVLFVLF